VAPGADWKSAAFLPGFRKWGEVLAVAGPGSYDTEKASCNNVERVVAVIHDAATGDQEGAECGNEDDEELPYFTTGIEDVELCREV